MRWLEFGLALVGAAVVGYYLIGFIAGSLLTERITGGALMQQELKKRGIRCEHLPKDFYDECADFATAVANVHAATGGRFTRKLEFTRTIEALADLVVLWRTNPSDTTFKSYGDSENTYYRIFSKYDL